MSYLHTLCAVSVSCHGEHRPVLRSAARAVRGTSRCLCPRTLSRLALSFVDVAQRGVRWDSGQAACRAALCSLQGLSFWVCVMKTSVWVVDWGLRESVVANSH